MHSASVKVQRRGQLQALQNILLCRMSELWFFKMSQLLKEAISFFNTKTERVSTSLPLTYSLETGREGLFLERLPNYVA